MNYRLFSLIAALAALLPAGAGTPRITVDAGKSAGPVNPLVFGANIEAADDRGIFDRPLNARRAKGPGTRRRTGPIRTSCANSARCASA